MIFIKKWPETIATTKLPINYTFGYIFQDITSQINLLKIFITFFTPNSSCKWFILSGGNENIGSSPPPRVVFLLFLTHDFIFYFWFPYNHHQTTRRTTTNTTCTCGGDTTNYHHDRRAEQLYLPTPNILHKDSLSLSSKTNNNCPTPFLSK